ncbi:MAG: diguanylate cyclase [Pseudomonadota bacterium]
MVQLPARPDPSARGALAWLGDLVFSTDPAQRRCLTVLTLTAIVYGVSIAIMAYGAAEGIFALHQVQLLGAACALAALVFYGLIRSGWNRRCAEPTLAFPQALTAQTLVAGAYAITGPVHAGVMILLPLVMTFAMFDMAARHARILMVYTVALMGAVMWERSHALPQVYVPTLEAIYFVLVATVMPAVSQLSAMIRTMRHRVKTQKVELERALAHIQQMATHDDLTGLANRRHMLTLLNDHALRHARGGPAFYVAMADLDHFKQVNDTYGHAVGDEALCTFARQALLQLRNTDIIGRWGGEEFLIMMPETPPGDPNVGVERLRLALGAAIVNAQHPDLRVAFSTGLSRYRSGEAVGDTIERADRALYAAKSAGRNRTVAL